MAIWFCSTQERVDLVKYKRGDIKGKYYGVDKEFGWWFSHWFLNRWIIVVLIKCY